MSTRHLFGRHGVLSYCLPTLPNIPPTFQGRGQLGQGPLTKCASIMTCAWPVSLAARYALGYLEMNQLIYVRCIRMQRQEAHRGIRLLRSLLGQQAVACRENYLSSRPFWRLTAACGSSCPRCHPTPAFSTKLSQDVDHCRQRCPCSPHPGCISQPDSGGLPLPVCIRPEQPTA